MLYLLLKRSMAKEGRKVPSKIKELRGTVRKDRKSVETEVEFTIIQDIIPPPPILGEHGKRQWEIIVREYKAIGLINTVDIPALTIYCAAWDDWVSAKTELDAMDEKYFKTETGYEQIRPQVTIMEKARNTIERFGNMFGLNPVARSRIGGGSKKEGEDEFAKLYD